MWWLFVEIPTAARQCRSLFMIIRARGDQARGQTANHLEQGHVVTLEITSGVVYRGKLLEGA